MLDMYEAQNTYIEHTKSAWFITIRRSPAVLAVETMLQPDVVRVRLMLPSHLN